MSKKHLIKLHWFLASQLGFDLRQLIRSIMGLPAFFRDFLFFKKMYTGRITILPCLHDRFEEAGATKSEYFWQDLLVARWIFAAMPRRHVDIGSRVDGFVAHVASFRDIEVFDVRPISTQIPSVVFKQADVMRRDSLPLSNGGYCDSLSCLHAIEHFGLGRYGDRIDPEGYQRGIENMAELLTIGGTFYLATPIGRQRVEFNANWVFDPRNVINLVESEGMQIKKLLVFGDDELREILLNAEELGKLAAEPYNLGIFAFHKIETKKLD